MEFQIGLFWLANLGIALLYVGLYDRKFAQWCAETARDHAFIQAANNNGIPGYLFGFWLITIAAAIVFWCPAINAVLMARSLICKEPTGGVLSLVDGATATLLSKKQN